MTALAKGDKKLINAWAFYDWANAAYNLIITSTIFPIYYASITESEGSDVVEFLGFHFINTALYTYAISFAFLLIASISPLLSGIADYSGKKKRFMQFFCTLGALSCASMYFFTAGRLEFGILLVILACIGSSGSMVFYNAYLPEVAPVEQQDRVSAKGFALGYFGSTFLLMFCLSMLLKPEWFGGISSEMASRYSFVLVGVWWIGFAQIPFYYLPVRSGNNQPVSSYLFKGYKELIKVVGILKQSKRLKRFLLAFFVYNMGVQTIILVSTLFGRNEIHMGSAQLLITILILQFVAIIGAFLFSTISKFIGNIRTLQCATLIWIGVCVSAYFVYETWAFYIVAVFVGLVMGGIQAMSRSTYSKMLPDTVDHASFFSFYDVCDKMGIVLGMALFGFIDEETANMRNPILSLITFFVLGFILLMRVPHKEETAEKKLVLSGD